MVWSFFRKDNAKPKRFARAQRYVYLVGINQEVPGVTNRKMMRVAATSEEDAKLSAMKEIARRSGINLRSADIVSVTGGRRKA
jgi:hypothetical protein